MKPRKKRLSLLRKAKQSAGRSKCSDCPAYNGLCPSPDMFEVCFHSYVKGFIKGYKTCNKEIKDNYLKVLNSIK